MVRSRAVPLKRVTVVVDGLYHWLLLNRTYLLVDLGAAEAFGNPQVITGLQVHPKLSRRAEVGCDP